MEQHEFQSQSLWYLEREIERDCIAYEQQHQVMISVTKSLMFLIVELFY